MAEGIPPSYVPAEFAPEAQQPKPTKPEGPRTPPGDDVIESDFDRDRDDPNGPNRFPFA